jgi:two-component system, OmpR family, sensor kinase
MNIRAPRSLRGRLLLSTLLLLAAGLLVADVATFGSLRSFLVRRVDQQLRSAVFPVDRVLDQITGGHPHFGPSPTGLVVPPGTYGAFVDPSGRVMPGAAVIFGYQGQRVPAPRLPGDLPGSSTGPAVGPRFFTTTAANGGRVRYRSIAVPLAAGQGTLVVAIPLAEISGTLRRLLVVEVLATGAVMALGGALAYRLVRGGLRPLEDMGETAGAIAGGELSRRVEPAEADTEVGRLGLALNAMLGQIETAFDKQRASEERLRQFVADASHELRTPLTSIRGYAELFRRGASTRPDDLAKAMERIEAEASRMGVLVEDLLLLARLDKGVPLDLARVDLASLASRAVEDARAADPERRIDLLGDGPLFVEGDEARLKQVLDNLFANVRVHTPPGTPASVTMSADGAAKLDVADEGPGIPTQDREHLFERFYRGDPSRSREKGGAGLGLAIASEIARAHGGSLDLVDSNGGARFRLTLPLASESA